MKNPEEDPIESNDRGGLHLAEKGNCTNGLEIGKRSFEQLKKMKV